MLHHHDLPCGCRTCGCTCAQHDLSGAAQLCAPHTHRRMLAILSVEITRLIGCAAFCAVLLAWAFALA